MCGENRIIANDLLNDFHSLAKRKEKGIKEFFEDKIFQEKLLRDAIDELYFEVAFGRSNLRNFIRNYNFFTGEISMEALLPFPACSLCGE